MKKYFRSVLVSIFMFLIFLEIIQSQNISKNGGICFRTDDNQPISKYLEYAAIFDKYSQNFSFAINLDLTNINSEYITGVKALQAKGHEMMDHTPSHKTNFFYTILDPNYFQNHPGVESINGNKVKLKHAEINISNAKRSGFVKIEGNIVKSPDGIFGNFSKSDCYLFFPSLNKLVYINDYANGWIDNNTVKITNVWYESINLGSHQNIQFYNFDIYNVHLTIDAIKAIAEESLRLADHFGFIRPKTWIQPGGYHPSLYRNELKIALSEDLDYKAAGIFADPSLKVFNEYNPQNDKQFGMCWGDFYDDTWTINQLKEFIANKTAKHHVVIGHSHFRDLLGEWSEYLERTEELIKWCINENIPIKTYTEWADILYNQTPDPYENIFPSLSTDKDKNGKPDGYQKITDSHLDLHDSPNENETGSISIEKIGRLIKIIDLAGLEKGENQFEIWTKGEPGNFIEVDFKIGSNHSIFKFPAENAEWTKYNLAQSVNGNTSLFIPENISTVDVSINCSNYSSGNVKISGMKLAKSLESNNYLTVNPRILNLNSNSGNETISIVSNTDWTINENLDWINIEPINGTSSKQVNIHFNSNNSLESRTGKIEILFSEGIEEISVFQSGLKKYLRFSTDSIFFDEDSSTSIIKLESNYSWVLKQLPDWLIIEPDSGFGNSEIKIICKTNTDSLERNGIVQFSCDNMTEQINVIQKSLSVFKITVVNDSINAGNISGCGKYLKNSKVTLIASPNTGFKFLYWIESDSILSTDSIYIFNVTCNRNLIVKFVKITTGLEYSENLPKEFSISQNYPNPFNPTTTIKYSIPSNLAYRQAGVKSETSNVKLIVYDVLGKEVATLVNEKQNPGNYEVTFDASNLSSGIYFYRFQCSDFTETKKMFFIK